MFGFLAKVMGYSLVAMLGACYLGLAPADVIPASLRALDSNLGSPLYEGLNNIHELGDDHLGQLKIQLVAWLAQLGAGF